jgi:hypothetical protein
VKRIIRSQPSSEGARAMTFQACVAYTTNPSLVAATSRLPSGLKASEGLPATFRFMSSSPVLESHTLSAGAASSLTARSVPSGEKSMVQSHSIKGVAGGSLHSASAEDV